MKLAFFPDFYMNFKKQVLCSVFHQYLIESETLKLCNPCDQQEYFHPDLKAPSLLQLKSFIMMSVYMSKYG